MSILSGNNYVHPRTQQTRSFLRLLPGNAEFLHQRVAKLTQDEFRGEQVVPTGQLLQQWVSLFLHFEEWLEDIQPLLTTSVGRQTYERVLGADYLGKFLNNTSRPRRKSEKTISKVRIIPKAVTALLRSLKSELQRHP